MGLRQHRRILTTAVAVVVAVATSLVTGRAAGGPEHLPTAVADLSRALGAADHVIIYRDGPSTEIERVVVHEGDPAREWRTDEAAVRTAPEATESHDAPEVPRDARSEFEQIAHSARPRVTVTSPAAAARTPAAATRIRQENVAAASHATQDFPISEVVIRDILDRANELIEAARNATLGGDRTEDHQ